MVWLVIALVLIAAVGPIFWLLPSKRSRRLAELRTAARRAGLIVEVARIAKLDAAAEERVSAGGRARDAKVDCAAYRMPMARPLANAPRWMLLKSDRENRYVCGWSTLAPPAGLPAEQAAYWREIEAIVNALPGGCIAVEARPQAIAWYGRERLGDAAVEAVVTDIRDGLEAIVKLHKRLEVEAR